MTENGFIKGFNESNFLNHIALVCRQIIKNKVDGCGKFDSIIDKFFFPTSAEYGNYDSYGGTVFKYFQTNDGLNKRKKYLYNEKLTPYPYWLASPNVDFSHAIWIILADGTFSFNQYSHRAEDPELGIVPACVII